MDVRSVVKVGVAVLVILAAAPFLLNLLPEPITAADARDGFAKEGYTVIDFSVATSPQLEAVEQANMTLEAPGATSAPMHAALYRFDNEGKLKKQYEYHKPDMGQGVAQAFVQASGLGATRQPTPVAAGMNGKWLIVVTGPDKSAVRAAVATFEAL